MKTLLRKKQTWGLVLAIVGLLASIVLGGGVYFLNKYWYPPVTAYPASEVGKEAIVKTDKGMIYITLTGPREAVAQFTRFSRSGFYTATHIHRVVPSLLVEMGDPLTKDMERTQLWGQGGSAGIFKNKTTVTDVFEPGTVAMTGSNVGTYGSQFFISTARTPWLTGKHTVIGKVTQGMEIVKIIEASPTDSLSRPITPITVLGVTVL